MLNLEKLNVSLTKHGAHKIALLFRHVGTDHVLDSLWGHIPGIRIDEAQARKNLSASAEKVPALWEKARASGHNTVDALVLIAIIFSHHDLITAMINSATGPHRGRLVRGRHLAGKAYTNFAHSLLELGFGATGPRGNTVSYDLSNLPRVAGLAPLALDLMTRKLRTAGMATKANTTEVMIENGLERALGLTPEQLKKWLNNEIASLEEYVPDEGFLLDALPEPETVQPFAFRPGHREKKEDDSDVQASPAKKKMTFRHNALQSALYEKLSNKFGKKSVGTEVPTGLGTSLDAVLKKGNKFHFYEIKIASTVKACIRQAIPQLLEYAYWQGVNREIEKLIIVGEHSPSETSERYLALLRDHFHIPVEYQQFKLIDATNQNTKRKPEDPRI